MSHSTRRLPARHALALLIVAAAALLLAGCHKKTKHEFADNDVLYQKAQGLIERRRFAEAIRVLGDVGLSAPVTDKLDPEIKLALADAYFYQNGTVNAVEAQSRYEQFLNFYPLHPKARYARYMIGVCLMQQAEDPENDQEFSQKALRHFEQLVSDLPAGDPWSLASKVMLLKAQDRLAEHEWTVGSYYLGQQRWNGAIGRLRALVDQYPGSHRRPEAMYQLATAFKNVGDNAQARLTLDRLIAEFPGTPVSDRAEQLKRSIPEEGVARAPQPAGGQGKNGSHH